MELPSMASTLNKYSPRTEFYKMEPQCQGRITTWRAILNVAAIIGGVDITIRLILFVLKIMLNSLLFSIFIFTFQVVANYKEWGDINQNPEAPQQQEKHNQTYKAAEIVYKAATGESLTDIILQAALDEDISAKRKKDKKEKEKTAKREANEAAKTKNLIEVLQSLIPNSNVDVAKNTEEHITKKEASKDSEDVVPKIPNEAKLAAKERNSFNGIFKRSKERKLNDTRQKEIEEMDVTESEELPLAVPTAPLPRLSYQDVLKEMERERLEALRKSYGINESIPEELRKSSEVITSIRQQQQTFYPEETFTDIPEISAKNVSHPISVPEHRQRAGFIECFTETSHEPGVMSHEEDTSKITKKKSFLRRKFSKLKKGLKISRKNSFSKSGSKHK